jgi:hypothetical protein
MRTKSDICERVERLLSGPSFVPKPLNLDLIRDAQPRYIARHGLKHAIEVRDFRGRRELRYVSDEQLAALGLSSSPP